MESLRTSATIQRTLRLVLFVSFLAGIAPLKFVKTCNGWRIQSSRSADLYGRTLVSFFCIFATMGTIAMIILTPLTSLFTIVDILAVVLSVLPAITGALLASLTAKKRMKFMIHQLARLEEINTQICQIHNYKNQDLKEKKIFVCVFILMIFGVITVVIEYLIFVIVEQNFGNICDILSIFNYILYEYIKLISIHFFGIMLPVLNTYIHFNVAFNSMLKRINEEKLMVRQRKEISAELHRLTLLYSSLCDVMNSINNNYGALLAHHVLVMMLNVIADLYALIGIITHIILAENLNKAIDFLSRFVICCSMLFSITNFIIITEPCHQIQIQIKLTKITLSKLLRATSPAQHEINTELLLFYRHVTMFDVNITPLKMFKLNRRLTTKILASVISYVVILINGRSIP